jgi:GxxExxY protein
MRRGQLFEERLTYSVIGRFFEVDRNLGFGFHEHFYVSALERELLAIGHEVVREVYVPVFYKGEVLGRQRLDMLVDGKLVVETKATIELHPSAKPQLLNYLRATRLEIGLLLHFGPIATPYRVVCRNTEKGVSLPSIRSL